MKALSLTQPWATLVAIGAKRLETRSWSTTYRGPLAIHAAKRFPRNCQELVLHEPFASALDGIPLPTGVIIAGMSCYLGIVAGAGTNGLQGTRASGQRSAPSARAPIGMSRIRSGGQSSQSRIGALTGG